MKIGANLEEALRLPEYLKMFSKDLRGSGFESGQSDEGEMFIVGEANSSSVSSVPRLGSLFVFFFLPFLGFFLLFLPFTPVSEAGR